MDLNATALTIMSHAAFIDLIIIPLSCHEPTGEFISARVNIMDRKAVLIPDIIFSSKDF